MLLCGKGWVQCPAQGRRQARAKFPRFTKRWRHRLLEEKFNFFFKSEMLSLCSVALSGLSRPGCPRTDLLPQSPCSGITGATTNAWLHSRFRGKTDKQAWCQSNVG